MYRKIYIDMETKIADVVISRNGRDKDKLFIIIGKDDDYSLLVDGKGRKLEKPKRKKNKHIKPEGIIDARLAKKLISGEKVTNNEVRRALAEYAEKRKEI